MSIGGGFCFILPPILLSIAAGYVVTRMTMADTDAKTEDPMRTPDAETPDPFSLELGYGLIPLLEKDKEAGLLEQMKNARHTASVYQEPELPKVRIIDNMLLESYEYRIKIKGVEMWRGNIPLKNGERGDENNTGCSVSEASAIITSKLLEVFKNQAEE
jgi:flagellar biosynthesis protein FlhA